MAEKRFSLRIDSELWNSFLKTIPRSEYASANEALNKMIAERVVTVLGKSQIKAGGGG